MVLPHSFPAKGRDKDGCSSGRAQCNVAALVQGADEARAITLDAVDVLLFAALHNRKVADDGTENGNDCQARQLVDDPRRAALKVIGKLNDALQLFLPPLERANVRLVCMRSWPR